MNVHLLIVRMARTRTVSDATLMGVVTEVLRRVGPAQFTLADVAKEVELTPATLVQRFGSKRGLLLAFARNAADNAAFPFRRAQAANTSPLQALRDGLMMSTNRVESRQQVVNGLAGLLNDLDDPELLEAARLRVRNTLSVIGELLDAALLAGELGRPTTDRQATHNLASTVYCAWNGAVIQWAIDGEQSFETFLDEALSPLIGPAPRSATPRKGGRRKVYKQ